MEFNKQIAKFNEKVEKKLTQVFRGSALEIFKAIILRSPVKSGRFRANWRTSINVMSKFSNEENDKAGNKAISYARETTKIAKLGDAIYMTNNLPYSARLENGYSKQAPAGMVKITVLEWNAKVDAQARGIL